MKNISMRKAISLFGGTNVELHSCYHYQMGFFEKDGQLYYINSGNDGMRKRDGQLDIMYRTAEHRKDWIGGTNRWDFLKRLNDMGYAVTSCRVKS